MIDFVSGHILELVFGVFLMLLGRAFSNWADSIKQSSARILTELARIRGEIEEYKLLSERRVTRLETRVEFLYLMHDRGKGKDASH